jgi:hypothetical protein
MIIILSALGLLILTPALSYAADCNATDTASAIQCGTDNAAGVPNGSQSASSTLNSTTENVINILSLVAGAAAVIMLIVGGFRYVTSAGNPESAKGAKNTILYAVIGLIIVGAAQIIVHFVLYNTTQTPSDTNSSTGPSSNGSGSNGVETIH